MFDWFVNTPLDLERATGSVEKAVLKNFAIFTKKTPCWTLFITKLQAFFQHSDWKWVSLYIRISPYSVWMREKNWKKNCGTICSLWLWLVIAIVKECAERCRLQWYCTSVMNVHSKSKVTENISNLQEWHQNTKTFISYKTFTVETKTKTCQEWPNLVIGCLIQVFYKTTTFPKRPLLRGSKSCLIQVWLYISLQNASIMVLLAYYFFLIFCMSLGFSKHIKVSPLYKENI